MNRDFRRSMRGLVGTLPGLRKDGPMTDAQVPIGFRVEFWDHGKHTASAWCEDASALPRQGDRVSSQIVSGCGAHDTLPQRPYRGSQHQDGDDQAPNVRSSRVPLLRHQLLS